MNKSMDEIKCMANRMRMLSLDMAFNAGRNGAHLGGALSAIEIMAVLYGGVLKKGYECDEDRVLISKAHCVLAYYSALYEAGVLSKEDIAGFEKNGSLLTGHPQRNLQKGIEYSGGSLGMAISVAVGMAIRKKKTERNGKVYVLLGDGECEEGSVWESLMVASHYKLDNLIVIIDNNGLQSDGNVEEIAGETGFKEKFEAFGCYVSEVDGHDIASLLKGFEYKHSGRPLVIIADTVKGKGVSFMENDPLWHHGILTEELYKKARAEVESNG